MQPPREDTAIARTPARELALARFFPGVAEYFPRHPLTRLPTPVHPLARLARARGIASLWVKRDDVTSPLYGGNKPRKLEWLLGESRRRGRRAVITFGGIGTHHGLATAICARDAGMRTVLVLLPQPVTEHVRRCLLLHRAFGAELHLASSVAGVAAVAMRLWCRGIVRAEPLGIVPTGGTSPRGAIGYVNAALELAEQVGAGEIPEPDYIFVPLGSGGTAAGLMLGAKLGGLRTRVVAVLVTDILPPSAARLTRLARATLRLLRRARRDLPEVLLQPADVTVVRDHLGSGYGAPTQAGIEARRVLAEEEGIDLETTYTAKGMAALLQLAAQPHYQGKNILFWNTYSSVDPGSRLERLPSFRDLPPAFHRFFARGH